MTLHQVSFLTFANGRRRLIKWRHAQTNMITNHSDPLPRFVCDLIASFPSAGNGVHLHLFRLARYLHALRGEEEIFALLRAASDGCGRRVSDKEIRDAIANSKPVAWQPGEKAPAFGPTVRRPVRAPRQHARIDELVRSSAGLYDLWESSPIRFEGSEAHTEPVIDALFAGDPLLCVAKTNGKTESDFATRRREVWRGRLSQCALIVPNPMLKVFGKTQDGRESQHALEACGPRRFLVVEFDFSEKAKDGLTDSEWAPLVRAWRADGIEVADACAALLVHLAEFAPMALAVHSGGKSLHGWFYCAGRPEEKLWPFMEYSHALGADPATWNRHQFVRMPDGVRDNGKRQAVYFFSPGVAHP